MGRLCVQWLLLIGEPDGGMVEDEEIPASMLYFHEGHSVCVCVHLCVLSPFSHAQVFATLWTVAHW